MLIEILFIILILLCYIVTFIHSKNDILFKKFFTSFFNTLYITAASFFITTSFYMLKYDIQNNYPNIPIEEIFSFFGIFLILFIPFTYIIVILIKINKKGFW